MSKGGSSTSKVEIPEYIEKAAQRNLNKAESISQLGYVPEYGPTIAAFTPMQEAAFQNTANTAGAFGVAAPASQRDIMGGMDDPTNYAGGVRGYSAEPLYDQMVSELAARRPAQKSYIDSFFIDPTSGNYAYQPFDYTQYNTMAEDARVQAAADRGNDLAIAQVQANPAANYNTSTTSINTPLSYMPGGVNDPFLTSVPSQAIAGLSTPSDMAITTTDTTSPLTGETLPAGSYVRPGSAAPTASTRPVARPDSGSSNDNSSTTSSDTSNIGNYGGDRDGDGVPNALDFNDGVGWADASKSGGGGSSAPSGGFTSIGDMFDGGGPGASGGGGGGGGGCVVATHAVESGAFTPKMKREAVVWCMQALHGKWWGEAVRRGYRHLGRKKIEQGKAREHYAEFSRYIQFANGKKRDVRGAVTFALRTAQFFAVGLVKKDA